MEIPTDLRIICYFTVFLVAPVHQARFFFLNHLPFFPQERNLSQALPIVEETRRTFIFIGWHFATAWIGSFFSVPRELRLPHLKNFTKTSTFRTPFIKYLLLRQWNMKKCLSATTLWSLVACSNFSQLQMKCIVYLFAYNEQTCSALPVSTTNKDKRRLPWASVDSKHPAFTPASSEFDVEQAKVQ